jgi:hypothetical protein
MFKKLCCHYSFLDSGFATIETQLWSSSSLVCVLLNICFHFHGLILHFLIIEVDHRVVVARLNFRYSFKDFVTVDTSSIERVEEFKYLGTTLTNQNSIQAEIKSRLKLGNACYYSVQNLLSSRLLSKNLKINYIEL